MQSASHQSAAAVDQPRRGTFDLQRVSSDATIVVGASLLANACSYIFHFVLSRRLGPELYGTLATMIAISSILVVIGSSVGTVTMQETARMWVAHLDRQIAPFLRQTGSRIAALGAVMTLVFGLASLQLRGYFHIDDARLWWLLAAYVGLIVFAGFTRGAAQGAHRFAIFGGSLIAEGIGKVVFSASLVTFGFGVAGALGGLLCSSAIGIAIILPMAFGGEHRLRAEDQPSALGPRALKVLGVASALSALLYIDMLFAKHHFNAAQAGFFGAAGTIARTIPYGAGLAMLFLGPLAAAAKHASDSSLRRVLVLVAASAAAAIAVGLTAVFLLAPVLIHITYGPLFAPAATILRLYAIDEALLAVSVLGASYLLAIGEYAVFSYLAGGVVLEAALMAAFGSTPVRLLTMAIIVNATLVPAVWWFALRSVHAASSTTGRSGIGQFFALIAHVSRHPSLVINAVRERGLAGFVKHAIRSSHAGFSRQLEYISVATMDHTPASIMRACSTFIADAQEGDADTLLVRLTTGEKFYVRRASCDKDLWLLWETFCYAGSLGTYDVRDQIVLDIGANLGDTAVYYGRRGARVIGWEPSTELAALARRNCELNGVPAEIYAQGVGGCGGTFILRSTGRAADFASSTIFPGAETNLRTAFAGGSEQRVEVVPFAEVLDRFTDVFLAKINCEGCEYPALMSVSDVQLRKVAHYIVDCHADPTVIADRLRSAGFQVRLPQDSPLFADRIG